MKIPTGWAGNQTATETSGEDSGGSRSVFASLFSTPCYVISEARTHTAEADVICLGDFNADGSYFDETTYQSLFPSNTYDWLISNSQDTTQASSSNTYDRIVTYIASDEDFDGTAGVYRYDQAISLGSTTPDQISDHYPIYAEFWIGKDTD